MFKRVRWKALAALAAALAGVLASYLMMGKMQARTDVVSKVIKGYRYCFTQPSDWRITQDKSDASQGRPEAYSFSPTTSPVREWIAVHLFRQSPAVVPLITVQPRFNMETDTAHDIPLKAGYPEPYFQSRARILSERHFRIDGCPATVMRYESTMFGMTFRGTILFVYQPVIGTAYIVGGSAERRYSDQADREMEAIISSFHIEKVVPPGGKR